VVVFVLNLKAWSGLTVYGDGIAEFLELSFNFNRVIENIIKASSMEPIEIANAIKLF